MAEIQVPSEKVPPLVQDVGLVAGLLAQRGGGLYFEFEWFANAVAELKRIPSRRAELLRLLRRLLGKKADNTPPDRSWYTFSWNNNPTNVFIVLPPNDSGNSSTIGVGILKNFAKGPVSVQASMYAPLFALPVGSPVIVTGSDGNPIELVLSIGLGTSIGAGGFAFDGIHFQGDVRFGSDGPHAPHFKLTLTNNGQQQTIAEKLDALRGEAVREAINAVLARDGVVTWLNQPLGQLPLSVGAVLVAAGIVNKSAAGAYTFGSLDQLAGLNAKQIAELLIAKSLQVMAASKKPILTFGDGGIWIFGNKAGTNTDYGLRMQVPDIDLSPQRGPSIKLQLGKKMSGDGDSTWMSRSDSATSFASPGISLTLIREDAGNVPSFRPKVDLISLGVDIGGREGNPLVDVKGVTLDTIEPRFLLSLDFNDLTKIPWGIGLRCGDLGIPLGNGLSGGSANPIAQNLLSSGSTGGDKEPVNPTFSAAISRVFNTPRASVNVNLEQDGGSAETIWIPAQRAFGPLQCRRVGIEWPEKNDKLILTFLFDGGVRLAALSVDLEGLSLGIPLRTPGQLSNYSIDLQGLGISYVSGPLTISGAFLKNTSSTPVQYDGAALIKAQRWSIAAIGSYAMLDGEPSMFIFARLGATLGGPPFFFVTGLCAGFGYNRSIRIPTIDEVPSFPLLAGIDDPKAIGGDNPKPAEALKTLSKWVAPARGMNWFAAGVQFTSFQLVKSNAVLVVIPTGDFQAAILGVSRMKLGQEGPQFAYAELALSVVLHPSAGFLGVSAQLTSNSYVLTPDCHLTGGFAFWIWFDGEHAGDFVVTLGGYHPAFRKPAHYPDEERLGFSWQVNSRVSIRGSSYFALTPSCAMGGGALDVEFHAGDLRAWFRAHADFLFVWKPFYFIGSVGVSIGASYKLNLLFTSVTVSVELGADLDIWGPPTGGKVHVSWYIISFTIRFGADPQDAGGFLQWDDFRSLLPQNDAKPQALAALEAGDGNATPLSNVIKPSITRGLVSKDQDRWLVRGDALTFAVETAFPLTEANLGGATHVPNDPNYFVGVRPMGIAATKSKFDIAINGPGGAQDLGGKWTSAPMKRAVPMATWGTPLPEGTTPGTPSAETLPDRLVGVREITPLTVKPGGPDPVPLVNLSVAAINPGDSNYLPLASGASPVQRHPRPTPTSLQIIATTLVSTATVRTQLFDVLGTFGYDAGANGPMSDLAGDVNRSYPDAPMLGAPWEVAA
jgi:hypothetical protein